MDIKTTIIIFEILIGIKIL